MSAQKLSVAILNESTVEDFVQDVEAFHKSVDEQFKTFDSNGDGAVSREDISSGYGKLMALEYDRASEEEEEMNSLYKSIFERFDEEKNGTLSKEQFRSFMKELMLAMARSFGDVPIQVALDQDSLLMKAVQHEMSKH